MAIHHSTKFPVKPQSNPPEPRSSVVCPGCGGRASFVRRLVIDGVLHDTYFCAPDGRYMSVPVKE